MRLSPHLTFGGRCEEAFHFYERVFGGRLAALLRYGESPMANEVGPEWQDKILHATLKLGDHQELLGADVPSHEPPRGLFVLAAVGDEAKATEVFAALSEGGDVKMPLQKTFWSPAFGVVVDRFGVPWEVTC